MPGHWTACPPAAPGTSACRTTRSQVQSRMEPGNHRDRGPPADVYKSPGTNTEPFQEAPRPPHSFSIRKVLDERVGMGGCAKTRQPLISHQGNWTVPTFKPKQPHIPKPFCCGLEMMPVISETPPVLGASAPAPNSTPAHLHLCVCICDGPGVPNTDPGSPVDPQGIPPHSVPLPQLPLARASDTAMSHLCMAYACSKPAPTQNHPCWARLAIPLDLIPSAPGLLKSTVC